MSYSGKHLRGMFKILKYFFIVLLLIVVVTVLIGAFIYALYRVAVSSKTLYTYLFIAILCGAFLFFIIRSIYRKTFINFFLKLGKFFYSILIIGALVTVFLVLGAFVLRYPVVGAIITPLVIGTVIFLFSKWNIFSLLKIFLDKL
jgi:hypothetical protein